MNEIDLAALVLRIGLGVMIALHGRNKIKSAGSRAATASWFASIGMRAPRLQAASAAWTEIVSGVLLAIGLFVPTATGALIATMVVAIVVAHRSNGFFIFNEGQGWEYCAIIIVAGLAVGSLGGGRASLDHAMGVEYGGLWGFWTALILGVGGAALHLLASYRPASPGKP